MIPDGYEIRWDWVIDAVVISLQAALFTYCSARFWRDASLRRQRMDGWVVLAKGLKMWRAVPAQVRKQGLSLGEIHSTFVAVSERRASDVPPFAVVVAMVPADLEEPIVALHAKDRLPLLPALGLGGTFLGIMLALMNARFDRTMAAAEMAGQVSGVVESASAVFVVSVVGISLLIAGHVLHAWKLAEVNAYRIARLEEFESHVSFRPLQATMAQLDFGLFESSARVLGEAAVQISGIVGELAQSAAALGSSAQAMQGAAKSMSTTMEQHLAPFGATIANFAETSSTFTTSVTELKESNARVSVTSEKLAENVNGLTVAMRDGLNDSVTRMKETMDGFRRGWDLTVGQSLEELQALAQQIGTLSSSMEATNHQMTESSKALHQGMNQVRDGFVGSMRQLGTTLEQELRRSGDAFKLGTEVIDARATALDVVAEKSLQLIVETQVLAREMDGAAVNLRKAMTALEAASVKMNEEQQALVGRFFDEAGMAVAELTVQFQVAATAAREASSGVSRG